MQKVVNKTEQFFLIPSEACSVNLIVYYTQIYGYLKNFNFLLFLQTIYTQ